MAKKRTKAEEELREADHLEEKADSRPEQTPKKPRGREDFSQAAA
jgi:hypothetical protein